MITKLQREYVESRSGRVRIHEDVEREGVYHISIRSAAAHLLAEDCVERHIGAVNGNDLESLFDALGFLVRYRQGEEDVLS